MTMPGGVDETIVILDIDEKSLGELGRWPWDRRLMAELVDKLFDRYGIAVLAFLGGRTLVLDRPEVEAMLRKARFSQVAV